MQRQIWIVAPTMREAQIARVNFGVSPNAVKIVTNAHPARILGERLRPEHVLPVNRSAWSRKLTKAVHEVTEGKL